MIGASLDGECSAHADIFRSAVRRTPPVYFRKRYADFFWECVENIPGWLPKVVLSCATTENSGAHALMDIWTRVNYHDAAEAGLLRHARDESRHARLFVELAGLAFPGCYAPGLIDSYNECLKPVTAIPLRKNDACLLPEETLLDYLVQLNIVEMRTRVHLHLLAPAYYGLTPEGDAKERVGTILNGLAGDEARHIAYTSQLLDDWARNGSADRRRLVELYSLRLSEYNEHTVNHCDSALHDYGQGRLPDFCSE